MACCNLTVPLDVPQHVATDETPLCAHKSVSRGVCAPKGPYLMTSLVGVALHQLNAMIVSWDYHVWSLLPASGVLLTLEGRAFLDVGVLALSSMPKCFFFSDCGRYMHNRADSVPLPPPLHHCSLPAWIWLCAPVWAEQWRVWGRPVVRDGALLRGLWTERCASGSVPGNRWSRWIPYYPPLYVGLRIQRNPSCRPPLMGGHLVHNDHSPWSQLHYHVLKLSIPTKPLSSRPLLYKDQIFDSLGSIGSE